MLALVHVDSQFCGQPWKPVVKCMNSPHASSVTAGAYELLSAILFARVCVLHILPAATISGQYLFRPEINTADCTVIVRLLLEGGI